MAEEKKRKKTYRTYEWYKEKKSKQEFEKTKNPDLFSGCVNTVAIAYYFVTNDTENFRFMQIYHGPWM